MVHQNHTYTNTLTFQLSEFISSKWSIVWSYEGVLLLSQASPSEAQHPNGWWMYLG